MQVPVVMSEFWLDSASDGVQVTGGSLQTLPTSNSYFLACNNLGGAGGIDGVSLLYMLIQKLQASLGGVTWTAVLDSNLKVKLSHNSGSSKTVTLDATLATYLGFASASFAVPNGGSKTAEYRSRWLWCPDRPVSDVEPVRFDPAIQYQHLTSRGSTASRAPDQKAAYLVHGSQGQATYVFKILEGAHKLRPDPAYPNEDLQGYWHENLRRGRRQLWWRDQTKAMNSEQPSEGSASPYNYVIYRPDEDLVRGDFYEATESENLRIWTARLSFWVTEAGETPLGDNLPV